MSASRVDAKKRIVLPDGQPGEVFDIQQEADGYRLVRLENPELPEHVGRAASLQAMEEAPLRLTITWDQLREETREP